MDQSNNLSYYFKSDSHFWPIFIPFNILLNPVLNSPKNLLSFSVDKVTTGAYNFVSVILNVAFVGLSIAATGGSTSGSTSLVALLVNMLSDHVEIKFISQLMACLVFSRNCLNVLMAQQFQLLFLCCYLLIFL